MKISYLKSSCGKLEQVCFLSITNKTTPLLHSKLEQDAASCSKMRKIACQAYYPLLTITHKQDEEMVKMTPKKIEVEEVFKSVFIRLYYLISSLGVVIPPYTMGVIEPP